MANQLYPTFKQSLLKAANGDLSVAGSVKALLVTAGYAYSATDQFLSAIVAGNRVGTAVALAAQTIANGVFNASNVTFSAVAAGTAAQAVVLYVQNASDAAAQLIAYIDTATGLPVTPNGGDITIAWDTGANKIFAL